MVSGVKDVVSVVKFCAEHDIPVTVRGKGAHSPWGMAQVSESARWFAVTRLEKDEKDLFYSCSYISNHLLNLHCK
jgi:hypothetical protein